MAVVNIALVSAWLLLGQAIVREHARVARHEGETAAEVGGSGRTATPLAGAA